MFGPVRLLPETRQLCIRGAQIRGRSGRAEGTPRSCTQNLPPGGMAVTAPSGSASRDRPIIAWRDRRGGWVAAWIWITSSDEEEESQMSRPTHGAHRSLRRMRGAWPALVCLACWVAATFIATDSLASSPDSTSQSGGHRFWVNVGVGGGAVQGGLGDAGGGFSAGISASYCRGRSLFSARGVLNTEIQFDIFGTSGPPESIGDIGVLYGAVARGPHALASISAGAGVVMWSGEEHSRTSGFGVPIECQLFWKPSVYAGLGIYGFANVNSERSFAGALFCVQLGRHI